MATITITPITRIERLLDIKLDVIITSDCEITIQCDKRCRLLSHLLHKVNLDVHCDKYGFFSINTEEIPLNKLLDGLNIIADNPQWIIHFCEKYYENEFMMSTTFGTQIPEETS